MAQTKLTKKLPTSFELIAGNICLDFINTLDNRPTGKPIELLKNFYDLARFGKETGILTPEQLDYFYTHIHLMPDEAAQAMRRARNLREALHEIFSAPINHKAAPQPAIARLNANLQDAALHSRLTQRNGRVEWSFDDMTSSCNAVLWPIARAAADLLVSSAVTLVRACSSPACQWLFLDTSKNHHRRWCSMKLCGNRTKVRKFYAKKRQAAGTMDSDAV